MSFKKIFLFFVLNWGVFAIAQEPTINFLFPADNTTVPENFVSKFEIENFSVPTDGFIKVFIESNSFDDVVFHFSIDLGWIQFNLPSGAINTITLELVDTNQNSFTPRITTAINVNSVQSINLSNLAELRLGNFIDFYKITSDTFSLYKRTSLNQTYIDDGTAGILMDDFHYTTIFGSSINQRNGYSEFIGRLEDDNGVLKLIPYIGRGKTFDESEFTISVNENIIFSNLINNIEVYESEMVTLEGGDFTGITSGQLFEENISYSITNGNETMVFKTIFSEADYIGLEIPESFDAITGIVSESNGVAQITPINQDSINVSSLFAPSFEKEVFTIYPNPTNGDIVNIKHSLDKQNKLVLRVYNMLDQLVIKKESNIDVLKISKLSKGVYMVTIENHKSLLVNKLIVE